MENEAFTRIIRTADPEELSGALNTLNVETYNEYEGGIIAVKAAYGELVDVVKKELSVWGQILRDCYDKMTVEDINTGEQYAVDVKQAICNLEIAQDFLKNPPIVDKQVADELKVEIEAIDWNKPIYTADEVKRLLNVSDNVLRRWVKDGWISYTQMNGSDKKFFEKESLLEFLRNPKIFYPRSK